MRVVAAGVGAFVVDSAAAGRAIQVEAIVICQAGQGEHLGLKIEVGDNAGLLQALGDELYRLLGGKGIHDAHADQVAHPHLGRHGATTGATIGAQTFFIFAPSLQPIDVGQAMQKPFACHLNVPYSVCIT